MTITTWKHQIRFADLFPASVRSDEHELLAGPIRFQATVDGVPAPWEEYTSHFTNISGEQIVYNGQAICDNIRLNLRLTVEKDGLLWYDILLLPQTWAGVRGGICEYLSESQLHAHMDSLVLEIPLQADTAQLYHFWPEAPGCGHLNSGKLPETLALPFRPMLWLGKEETGLAFYAESDQHWQVADADRTISVTRSGDEVLLRIQIFDSLPEKWQEMIQSKSYPLMPLKFSFGFQPTPVKPYEKKYEFQRSFMTNLWRYPDDPQEMDTFIGQIAQRGAKWCNVHEDWSAFQNYGWPGNEEKVRQFVETVHKNGMRCIPYFGYEYASVTPGFFEHAEEYVRKTPEGNYTAVWHREPHQVDYVVCYKSGYSQEMIDRCIHAMDVYGFDGVYLDGTLVPQACANPEHGCGYTDLHGVRHSTYPLRAVRDHAKRLYEAVESRGGIIESHQSSCFIPMISAYCHSYFDGETVRMKPGQRLEEVLDEGTMRAEYTGINWGVPIQFCVTEAAGFIELRSEDLYGPLMLYGTDVKAYVKTEKMVLGDYWKVMAQFGTEESKFYPLWHPKKPIRIASANVRCATWVKEDRALVLIVNLGNDPETAEISATKPILQSIGRNFECSTSRFIAQPKKLYFLELHFSPTQVEGGTMP